jgi:hypothetical protein
VGREALRTIVKGKRDNGKRKKVKGKRQNDDKLKQNLYPLTLILGPQRIVEKRFLSSEELPFSLLSDKKREKGFGQQPVPTCPAKGANWVNARARERRDMSVPSKDSNLS